MLRTLIVCLVAVCTHALVAPTLAASQVSVRASPVMIGKAPKKAPAKKAPPKKAAAVKKAPPKTRSGEGKGGIFPWVTNEPGTYAEVPMLADIQIRAMEKWVGSGANSIISNAFSVSKFLYPKNTRK